MFAKADGYFVPPLKGYHGVTQVNHLPSTVFNVVAGDVIRKWVMVAVPTEAGTEVLRETIQELAALFYADYGLVASPRLERLQRAFNVLTYLFNWVGISTNVQRMVSMAY